MRADKEYISSGINTKTPKVVANPHIIPLQTDPIIYPNASSKLFNGAIMISMILPWNFACPMLEAELAKEFCNMVIIIRPGAMKYGRSIPLIEFTDLPRAKLKTAKNSKELIAGPITVWIPTFKNLKTSFLTNVRKQR